LLFVINVTILVVLVQVLNLLIVLHVKLVQFYLITKVNNLSVVMNHVTSVAPVYQQLNVSTMFVTISSLQMITLLKVIKSNLLKFKKLLKVLKL